MNFLYGTLVSLFWAINFVAAKYALADLEPILLTFCRFFMVAIVLMPFVKVPLEKFRDIFLMAMFLGVGHFVLLFGALNMGLDVSTTVIAVQLGVPFSCLLGVVFMGDVIGKWRSFGLIISFLGVILLAGSPNVASNILAFVIAVCGAFCWAMSNIVLKKRLDGISIMSILAWMSAMSAPVLLILSLMFESNHLDQIANASALAIGSVAYTAFISTIVAYGLWYYLLKKFPVSQVAPYSLLVPVFGVILGMLAFDEKMTPLQITGSLVTLVGVAIIIIRRPRTAVQEG